jgi:DNA-binding FadR family transcriptional regulator
MFVERPRLFRARQGHDLVFRVWQFNMQRTGTADDFLGTLVMLRHVFSCGFLGLLVENATQENLASLQNSA